MANETASYQGTTYTNGNIPTKWLALLDGDNRDTPDDRARLRIDAATAWNAARAAVKERTGLTLTVVGWYRPIPQQETFFLARYYLAPGGTGIDRRKYKGKWYARHPNEAPAAIPGQSNHGLATTIDVDDFGAFGTAGNARRAKALPILREYGFSDTEGRSIKEPWHFGYDHSKNKHANTPEAPDMDKNDKQIAADTLALLKKVEKALHELHTGVAPQIDYSHVKAGYLTQRSAEKFELILLHRLEAEVKALRAAVATLAKSTGAYPDEITKAVTDAVEKALEGTPTAPDEE